jgi:thioredoxin reductase
MAGISEKGCRLKTRCLRRVLTGSLATGGWPHKHGGNIAKANQPSRVKVLGKTGSALGYMIRDFLHRGDIPFEWIELRDDEAARSLAGVSGLNDSRLPVCVFPDNTRLEGPTIRQITEKEGVRGEFVTGKGVVSLADGTTIIAKATICATGVEYARPGPPNESRFLGAGVYYGAGASEASLCRGDEDIFVVGGGNSAGQAAMHFARVARSVTMLVRDASLKSTLSQCLLDHISAAPDIRVLTNTEVTAIEGDDVLQQITVRNRQTGECRTFSTRWLFICIGGVPHTDWAVEIGIVRDDAGYLVTGPDLLNQNRPPAGWPLDRSPCYLETNMLGVFAVGDVRHGSIKRCASAVGEGAMAVAFVHRY